MGDTMRATPKRHWSVVILKNRVFGVLLFEALIMIVFSIAARKFLTLSNLNTIFLNACILAILACALVVGSAVQYAASFSASVRVGRRAHDAAGR